MLKKEVNDIVVLSMENVINRTVNNGTNFQFMLSAITCDIGRLASNNKERSTISTDFLSDQLVC